MSHSEKKVLVKIYMTPEKKTELEKVRAESGLSISEIINRLYEGQNLSHMGPERLNRLREAHGALKELKTVAAQSASLGNLLKNLLYDDTFLEPDLSETDVLTLIQDIDQNRSVLKEMIEDVRAYTRTL